MTKSSIILFLLTQLQTTLSASTPITFQSQGETIAADIFLPEGKGPFPAVVAGGGFGGVKEILLPDYANALTKIGVATLIFDYIGFGGSTGKVRQDVQPKKDHQVYHDALSFIEKDSRIIPQRLGAFGPSLGGGHTLVIASTDSRVKRAVAIIPHIKIGERAAGEQEGMIDSIVKDSEAAATGGKRVYIKTSGKPGEKAAMTSDGALEWLSAVSKNAPKYVNEVTASSLIAMGEYNVEPDAKKIKIPVRAITAFDDTITPGPYIHEALKGVPGVDIKDFPGTHFGLLGANLTLTVDLLVDWFKQL